MERIGGPRGLGVVALAAAMMMAWMTTGGTPNRADAGPLNQVFPCTANTLSFFANMDGAQETPPVNNTATGLALFQVAPDLSSVTLNLTTTGLNLSQVLVAHIHSPGALGQAASVRLFFFGGAAGGVQGQFTNPYNITVATQNTVPVAGQFASVYQDMLNGVAYFNVHTVQNPGGEIRGQIQCTPATTGPIVATATPTIVPLSVSQAIAKVGVTGQTGVPAAFLPGQTVTVTGQVQGTGRVTSSMTWNLTATVPAGVAAGSIPVAVISTTQGLQGFACAAVTAGATTVACNGTTAGNALAGSTVTVVFPNGATVTGTIINANNNIVPPLPLIPPPPAPPLPPPPPPPLLPPPLPAPPMAPMTAPSTTGAAAQPGGAAAAPSGGAAAAPTTAPTAVPVPTTSSLAPSTNTGATIPSSSTTTSTPSSPSTNTGAAAPSSSTTTLAPSSPSTNTGAAAPASMTTSDASQAPMSDQSSDESASSTAVDDDALPSVAQDE
jgi:hypothetical protein